MSKSKYKKGKPIRSIDDFEKSKAKYYKVEFGGMNSRTIHRAFLISWQHKMLRDFIYCGRIWEAELTEGEEHG